MVSAIRRASLTDAKEVARLLTELGHVTTDSDLQQRWPAWAAAGNEALSAMEREFAALYSPIGRPSITPEKLLRAMLLQAFYSIRSEM